MSVSAIGKSLESVVPIEEQKDLIAFLSREAEEQNRILSDPIEQKKQIQLLASAELDTDLLFIQQYLIMGIGLITNGSREYPHALNFFLAVVGQIVEKKAIAWSLIHGKTFFGHLQEYSASLPSELGIGQYLDALGEESLLLFEETVCESSKIESIVDKEKKIKCLAVVKAKAQTLAERDFPGAAHFLENLEKKIIRETADLKNAEEFCKKLKECNRDEEEKITPFNGSFPFKETLLGYLNAHGDFEAISLFLTCLSDRFWSYRVFKAICLEKAQNIEKKNMHSIKTSDTSEWLAVAWNAYYQSENPLFRSDVFTIEQKEVLDTLLREDVIQFLFLYMLTSLEDAHETRETSDSLGSPTIPFSLNLVLEGKKVPLPIGLRDHAMGFLALPEPDEKVGIVAYNTGFGLKGHHPQSTDGQKFQTFLEKDGIPRAQLFDSEIWQKIRQMNNTDDPKQLYSLIFDKLAAGGVQESSSAIEDYESLQHTGTCLFQHMQAMVRHKFMCCEKLGTKEMRYAAYRIIISDFMLFIGQQRFPKVERERVAKKSKPDELEFLETWMEKEEKLLAIVNYARSIDDKNRLEFFTQHRTEALGKDYATYWDKRQKRTMDTLRKMSPSEFRERANFNLKYNSRFKEEIAALIKEKS